MTDRSPMTTRTTTVHSATIDGCAAAVLPRGEQAPPAELGRHIEGFLSHLSTTGRAGVLGLMWTVDGVALATERRRLHSLDDDGRQRVLDRIARTGVGRDLLDGCKATISLVAGAHRHADEMWAKATAAPPARPDAELRVVTADRWPSRSRCDVVVIGSGAGGAFAARELARAGLEVVVVEEGRRHTVDEFRTGHPADRFGQLYRDGGATIALGRPPVVLPIGRGVGGTTLVNSGTCYRTPDRVVHDWHVAHGLGIADPATFRARLDDVESTLRVGPVPDDVMGRNGQVMLRGAKALGWDSGPLRRNAPGCAGSCQCAIGCPRNAKYGVHLNALPQACAAGATIVSELRVDRIDHRDGRAVGIVARRADGTTVTVTAPTVVVAAGTTETPPLLKRSGLGRHRRLGANLALHPALSAAGLFDETIVPWDGVLQSAAIEAFHEQDHVLVEATSTPPGMGSMALPGAGRPFAEWIDRADRLVTLGAMAADRGRGRVLGKRSGRTLLTYQVGDVEARRLFRALSVMGEALFAAGARQVLTGISGSEIVDSPAALATAIDGARIDQIHLAAFHPVGTAAAGGDPARHPVDPHGRLRGTRGVWVADASILPTCPEVNPQVSIMALAAAVGAEIVSELQGHR